MADIAGFEQGGITNQVLLPTKWNKDGKDGAWRMDVDIDVENAVDDESDEEDEDLDDEEHSSSNDSILSTEGESKIL